MKGHHKRQGTLESNALLLLVDQKETALASTTPATRTMKKQPHPMSCSVPIIPNRPRKLLGPSRASTSVQKATTSTCRRTRPPRTGRDELPAWMGSTRGAVPTPSADQSLHFFPTWKSAKNPLKRFTGNFLRKRCETRILEVPATVRRWNVNDLLRARCCTLSWVKTLKTFKNTMLRN